MHGINVECGIADLNGRLGFKPWIARYSRSALTEQTGWSVLLNMRVIPFRKGLVLDCLICMEMSCGLCRRYPYNLDVLFHNRPPD